MIRYIFVLVFAILALPLQAASEVTPPAALHLGIFPYMAPRQTVEFYGPVAANIQAILNQPVKLESAPSFTEFKLEMVMRQYDIALIQPFDYPVVVEKMGYIPIAQMSVPLITQFFVRDDSNFKTIEDLRGSTIAMPPAQSANAIMAVRALFDNKLTPGTAVEVNYFNSHDSCIQQVWAGSASACGTATPPVLLFEQRMQAKLRAIYDTPPIPHILFVASPRVSAENRAKLQQLITGWNKTENGRAILKGLGFPGFVVAKPAEYAMMRNYITTTDVKKVTKSNTSELLLGVFPYISARVVAQNFAPALPALQLAIGKDVLLRSAANFDAFSKAIASESYDLVLVQPFDYARASKHGYLPLAGMKGFVQGKFRVLENSPYQQISDFKGKVVALPPVDSAQSRLGRKALLQAGLTPGKDVTIEYLKNHEACIQFMRNGGAVACVISDIVLSMMPNEMQVGLRDVGLTEKVPGVLFMVHKRIPEKERKKLHNEILSWKDSEKGREILKSMQFGDFIAVNTNDYLLMKKFD